MRLIAFAVAALLLMMPFAAAFENVAEAQAYIEKHQDDEMPDGYALPLTFCSGDEMCVYSYAGMLRDLKQAYKKDYQSQRNVAYCLWTGCDGAVQKNVNLGCAWTIVLLASGSPKVIDLHMNNLKSCLGYANPSDSGVIKAQAAELFRVIYKREIAADWQ